MRRNDKEICIAKYEHEKIHENNVLAIVWPDNKNLYQNSQMLKTIICIQVIWAQPSKLYKMKKLEGLSTARSQNTMKIIRVNLFYALKHRSINLFTLL